MRELRNKTLMVKLNETEYGKLKEVANAKKLFMSEAVRLMIEHFYLDINKLEDNTSNE